MANTRRERPGKAVLILAAYPGREVAEDAARKLVQAGVLACATVTTGQAFYFWEGHEHAEPSAILQGKTTAARAAEAQRLIQESHPDKVPEILILEIAGGHPEYLAWVAKQVAPK
jgi:periplasmic divalent cation tolerance protein